MKREIREYPLFEGCRENLLEWSRTFETVFWLNSNRYGDKYGSFDLALAVGCIDQIKTEQAKGAFARLSEFRKTRKDWLFGYLSYDLKNDTEDLDSHKHPGVDFPELCFVQPEILLFIKGEELEIHAPAGWTDGQFDNLLSELKSSVPRQEQQLTVGPIQARVAHPDYIRKVKNLQRHIHRGDIYEVNFCQEFYTEQAEIDPTTLYRKLNRISAPPFSLLYRNGSHTAISASPERFMKKVGNKIISQPIKGTAKRGKTAEEDAANIHHLQNDPKERAENVMIVDLVRNDLARTATQGKVAVEELCGIYTFPQVHQMISTVVSKVDVETDPVEIIKQAYPMGSMTGAPKISAMELIEEEEESKRGLYSGAVGYFTPEGDYDFNVVIRSFLYNADSQYLSFSVGGAITALADAQKEYEECMLKAKALFQVLREDQQAQ